MKFSKTFRGRKYWSLFLLSFSFFHVCIGVTPIPISKVSIPLLFYSTAFERIKMAENVYDIQNPLNCPICLNLLKDPVTTTCGHSFCMKCIKGCWDQDHSLRRAYSCPTCRTTFNQRPALSRSTVLAEIVEGMKRELPAGPGDVKCDVCKGRKVKAIKSCLVCLASYCQTHIQPHYESESFKKHKLVTASPNLQQHICSQHHKALEIYCYNDGKCVCVVCMGNQHSEHQTVSAAAEMTKKQVRWCDMYISDDTRDYVI